MKSSCEQQPKPDNICKCSLKSSKLLLSFLWHCIGSCVSLRRKGCRYQKAFLLTGDYRCMKKAVACWRLAARRGDSASLRNWGSCFATGDGCRKDLQRAIACYKAAAARGDVVAIHNIGACYSIGEGLPCDAREAVRWLSQSAGKGFAWSVYYLGMHLCRGNGCAQDAERAFRCFRYAARRGIANAQYDLAVCYVNGEGVKRSVFFAVVWLFISALKGCGVASSIIEDDLLEAWLDGEVGLEDADEMILKQRRNR